MKRFVSIAIALLAFVPAAFAQAPAKAPAMKPAATAANEAGPKLAPGTYAHFSTSMGDFTVELFPLKAPKTVANFIQLANGTRPGAIYPKTNKSAKGVHYYDGVLFHRVVDTFMIQSGDPTGTGRGNPGYTIPDEKNDLRFTKEGVLAMANLGRPNTGGSQFFITLAPHTDLGTGYTIFGQVVTGMDVVHKIGKVPVKTQQGGGERSRPVTDVVLKKVTIETVK